MEDRIDDDVLQWYQQFRQGSEAHDHTTPNLFTPISETDIREFEKEFGEIIPIAYINFLKFIGEGRLREDINGGFSTDHENLFLNISEISEIMNRISEQWKVYKDFISENEIPFFSMGNDYVLVFRLGNGSKVYYPHLD